MSFIIALSILTGAGLILAFNCERREVTIVRVGTNKGTKRN